MKIRARLTIAMAGVAAVSMGFLGYGVIAVSARFMRRDAQRHVHVIDSSVRKAAEDALIQKDALLLISYINFLRAQYPALVHAEVSWQGEGREHYLKLGQQSPGRPLEERNVSVVSPANAKQRVQVDFDIDRGVLFDVLGHDKRRLIKIILLVALFAMGASTALALWLAKTITAPVARLAKLAGDIADGHLGAKLDWDSNDEIGQLVRTFNLMSYRLEEFDETKKNFVSSVTHELRSPLGAIESFLVLIQAKIRPENGGDGQCRDYLARIQVNVQRLSRFINDLLDVAKIEKGKMECVLKPMRLQEVASEICLFFGPKAEQSGVLLQSQLDGIPDVVGDSERLRQVLVNLVANSLKFTENGGRVLITGEQYREGKRRWVEITVADTGRGMAPRDVSRLFQAFSQGRNVSERVAGAKGTGLGLYISRSIIEQHGGKIEVKSALGAGTQISFSLLAAKEA